MSKGYFGKRTELYLEKLQSGLVTANHILHHHGIIDSYGNISVRNPDAPSESFFLSYATVPALVSSPEDLAELKIKDGEPVNQNDGDLIAERYIHSEIYKRFPGVNCIVHSGSSEVLPFGVAGVALKPLMHTASFLGDEVPVWDISSAYSSSDKHNLIVNTSKLGASLALTFARQETSVNFIRSKLTETLTGSHSEPSTEPEHPVVLSRGHGFTVAGSGIEEAVFMAIYTVRAAKVQTNSILLAEAHAAGKIEGSVDTEHGGKIKNGAVKPTSELHYLSSKEKKDATEYINKDMQQSWALWKREVESLPLYVNTCKEES